MCSAPLQRLRWVSNIDSDLNAKTLFCIESHTYLSIFLSVFVHQCAEYQSRRREEKVKETERRSALLAKEPTDITPPNKGSFVWSEATDLDKFESEWSMKPVSVKGVFDHTRELQVSKMRNGEKGVDIITPFYTHLNAAG